MPFCLLKLRTLGVKYDMITSAPALRIDIKDSRTAAFKSKAPALAECTNIANSPDTSKYKYCKIKYFFDFSRPYFKLVLFLFLSASNDTYLIYKHGMIWMLQLYLAYHINIWQSGLYHKHVCTLFYISL